MSVVMSPKRRREKIAGQYFVWLLGHRAGMWQADGRTNTPNAGRHSLGTKDYDEALSYLKRLDKVMAVELGLADESVLRDSEPNNLLLEDGVRTYLAHVRRPAVTGGARPKSAQRYRAVFDKAVPFLKNEGVSAWNAIKRHHLENYAAWLDGEGYAYRTEYLELTTIKQAMNYLIDIKLVPADCDIKMSLSKPKGTDTYCWYAEEVQAIVDRCRDQGELHWLADIVIALACTGMRISELASLVWSDVNHEANVITLRDKSRSRHTRGRETRTTKSGSDRSFPIHSDLRKVLEAKKTGSSSDRVFTGAAGAALRPDTVRSTLIKKVLAPLDAKFPSGDEEIGFKDGRLHSFRHYFCSTCANSGVPEQVLMNWLGHRSSTMVRHYYHLHDAEAQRQMAKLKLIGKPEAT